MRGPTNNSPLFSLELALWWKDFLMFKVSAASLRKGPASLSSAAEEKREVREQPRDAAEAWL